MDKPLVLLTVFSNDQEIKKKPVRASTYAELVDLAKEICPVVKDCELTRFFVYSEDFEEYVDADEDHEVAQKERFQLFFTVCNDYSDRAIPSSDERVYILSESLTSRSPHEIASPNVNSISCTYSPSASQYVGQSGTANEERQEPMGSNDAQRPEDTVHLYERYETPVTTLNPEDVRQRSMMYGKKEQRNLNQYELAINDMAFKLAMDNPALLSDRKQLLMQSRRMLHGSGYLYARSRKSRSKMFGTPARVNVIEEAQRHFHDPQEIAVEHEVIIEDEHIDSDQQDQMVHGEPSEEHGEVQLTLEEVEQEAVLYGKKGKRPLTKYQIAMNDMALRLAKMDPSLLKNRGQFLKKTREMLHKTGYKYARSGRSRSKVFGELRIRANKNWIGKKTIEPGGQKESSVDETPAAVVAVNQEMNGEAEIVDSQPNHWEPVRELNPDLIETQSKIFGYKKNRRLNKYEHAINRKSLEVATENPELLRHRGRLLSESRKRVHESGYRYARCQSSRSKVFGNPYRVSNAIDNHVFKDGSLGGIESNEPTLLDNHPASKSFPETELGSTRDNVQHSLIAMEKRRHRLLKPNSTAIKVVRNRAGNNPSVSECIDQEFIIYGRNGNRKLTKYESAMNKVALELATNDPELARNRGQFLAKCRLMLHLRGYRYARCQKSRSKVFGNPYTTSDVILKHESEVKDGNLEGDARSTHDATDSNIPYETSTEFDSGDLVHNPSTFEQESGDSESGIDDVTVIVTKTDPVESEDTGE